jgi:cytochrome c2
VQKEDGYDQRRHACKLDRKVINSLRQSTNGVLVNSHRRMRGLHGAGIFAIAPGYAQDVASVEKIFVQCKACHQVGENAKNAVGPVLKGLFRRTAGTIEGYRLLDENVLQSMAFRASD